MKLRRNHSVIAASCLLMISISVMVSCRKETSVDEGLQAEPNEELSAGTGGTVFADGPNAFGYQISDLTNDQKLLFYVGNSFFNQNWVQAPSSTTARDGLGPLFNSRSCSGCHFKDGRGRPPLFEGESPSGLLFRLKKPSQDAHEDYLHDDSYGGQLQDRAINGITAEGTIHIDYQEIQGQYADGTPYTLQKPIYSIDQAGYGSLQGDVTISPRIANQVVGMGYLEAIDEQTLLSFADPNDANQDGISGRPNYVWDDIHQKKAIGRFGWKANEPSLAQQAAGAFNGDMGITTSIYPAQNCTANETSCQQCADGGNPEIEDDDFQKVVLYISSLAVPARRNWQDQDVLQGKATFNKIGCAKCHIPKIVTGIHPTYDEFSNKTIRPYTDLLLHDMGPDLADGAGDFEATGSEWRTPPLWGIGLFETVNDHTRYLHDGRARNLTEAILWHGGEAKQSRESFKKLSAEKRAQLVKFLQSL